MRDILGTLGRWAADGRRVAVAIGAEIVEATAALRRARAVRLIP